jgi:sterol desaturase/sphingolipid hydroxylase (fatty acid hydroxylase superfamily)
MEHHYKNARTQFGLSSPLWDVVFQTFRHPASAALAQQLEEKAVSLRG